MTVRPAKTQISLGIRPVWSESSLSAWRKLGSIATHWAHGKDWSDWADAQADLSLHWAHTPFCWFCHEATQMLKQCWRAVKSLLKVASLHHPSKVDPRHDKTNKVSVRPAKTQISLGIHPGWSVFAVRMKKRWVLSYPLSAQWRHWSDWVDAQADLSLRWVHTHFVGFVMSWLCLRWNLFTLP